MSKKGSQLLLTDRQIPLFALFMVFASNLLEVLDLAAQYPLYRYFNDINTVTCLVRRV